MAFQACIIEGNFDQDENAKLKKCLKQLPDCTFVLLKRQDDFNNEQIQTYSNLTRELSVYLSPGITFVKKGEELYKTGLLFNPEGEVFLKQQQLFINQQDEEMGFVAGSMINIARTEYGNIGFIIGEDCWHPEVGRFLALEGVDLVLAFNEIETGSYWQQLAGIWSQVQQNQFFAMEVSRGGRDLIHGPCEITPYRTGILAPVGDEQKALGSKPDKYLEFSGTVDGISIFEDLKVTWARIDLNRLKEIRESYPLLKHLNPVLYQKSGPEELFTLRGGSRNEP